MGREKHRQKASCPVSGSLNSTRRARGLDGGFKQEHCLFSYGGWDEGAGMGNNQEASAADRLRGDGSLSQEGAVEMARRLSN